MPAKAEYIRIEGVDEDDDSQSLEVSSSAPIGHKACRFPSSVSIALAATFLLCALALTLPFVTVFRSDPDVSEATISQVEASQDLGAMGVPQGPPSPMQRVKAVLSRVPLIDGLVLIICIYHSIICHILIFIIHIHNVIYTYGKKVLH